MPGWVADKFQRESSERWHPAISESIQRVILMFSFGKK
jgi:hypothetical protein